MMTIRLKKTVMLCSVAMCLNSCWVFAAEKSPTKPQCPDIPLLQNASPEEIRLSMVTEQDRAFLSDQYCLVLFGPTLHHLEEGFFFFYTNKKQRTTMFRNYNRAYDRISELEAKFLFVHFFLRELSQKMTVTGHNAQFEKAHISLRYYSQKLRKPIWYSVLLSRDIPYQDFMHGLSKAQQGNPQPEDYPAMMALVAKVMDGNHRLSNDELNTLIQNL